MRLVRWRRSLTSVDCRLQSDSVAPTASCFAKPALTEYDKLRQRALYKSTISSSPGPPTLSNLSTSIMPASLPTRKIGTHDVTALGYGAMGIAAFYGQIPGDEERLKVCFASEACPIDTAHA
jgi:hypothetical protein